MDREALMEDGAWERIETAPRDGTRIRLGHELDRSSMKDGALCQVFGEWDGSRWQVSSFFRVRGGPYGSLTDRPTHWRRALAATSEGSEG